MEKEIKGQTFGEFYRSLCEKLQLRFCRADLGDDKLIYIFFENEGKLVLNKRREMELFPDKAVRA